MLFLIYLATASLIQLSSAQIFGSLGPQNVRPTVVQSPNIQSFNLPNNGVVLANNGISNLPVPNLQVGRTLAGTGNLVNSNLVAANLGNANLINSNLATASLGNFGAPRLGSNLVANRNVGSSYSNANLPVNIANGFNINTGTFAVTNMGLPTVLPNGRPCGIQIAADALQVAGPLSVEGSMPFYSTVQLNGNLPTSGSGYVSCGCGGQ